MTSHAIHTRVRTHLERTAARFWRNRHSDPWQRSMLRAVIRDIRKERA